MIGAEVKIAILIVVSLEQLVNCGDEKCGIRNTYRKNYIVGGYQAGFGEFPWQASLQVHQKKSWYDEKKWTHNCGASIINKWWLLTAAHCITRKNITDYQIVVGSLRALKQEDTTQTFELSRIIMHPNWNKATTKGDVTLLRVKRGLSFTKAVAPICLPDSSTSKSFNSNTTCIASGWGKMSPTGPISEKLNYVELRIIESKNCSDTYAKVLSAKIDKSTICAGSKSNDVGICQGDSGGPLACDVNGTYMLAGVTSFGVICGSKDHPAVFTNTYEYKSWIDKTIASNTV